MTIPPLKYTTNVGPTKALIIENDGSTYLELINRLHDSRFEAKIKEIVRAANAHDALVKAAQEFDDVANEPNGHPEGWETAMVKASDKLRAALRLAKGE